MLKTKRKAPERKRPQAVQPKPEEIAKLAYELYVQRGGTHGQDKEDWLQAEALLRKGRS